MMETGSSTACAGSMTMAVPTSINPRREDGRSISHDTVVHASCGVWRQLHHHGSTEEPALIAAYQKAILGAPLAARDDLVLEDGR